MKIHELLSTPDRWTQKTFARDESGNTVYSSSPFACSWCLLGAVAKCYGPSSYGYTGDEEIRTVTRKINCALLKGFGAPTNIDVWNDAADRKWEQVYDLVKELEV